MVSVQVWGVIFFLLGEAKIVHDSDLYHIVPLIESWRDYAVETTVLGGVLVFCSFLAARYFRWG